MASATKNVQLDNLKCRICLFPKQNLCPLFRRGLSMKVMKLAEIKMYEGDGLPSSICLDCELEVLRCTNFITRIQKADAKLKEMLVREKELCAAQEIKMKFKKLSERLPEKEDKYQEPSTSKGDILYDNNYHPEDENEQPLIEIEEFNVKQEIASFDQFLTEKEEVHSDGDQDHYGDDEHDNGQPEDEIELNPINHVDIVEDRHKGDEMEVSNDPLGQEEPLIETQKNESDPSVDPLTCMKQEVVPMDIDKDNSEAPGSSSSDNGALVSTANIESKLWPNTVILQTQMPQQNLFYLAPDNQIVATTLAGCVLDLQQETHFKLNTNSAPLFSVSQSNGLIQSYKHSKSSRNVSKPKLPISKSDILLPADKEICENKLYCLACNIEFSSVELLVEHKSENNYICRVCTSIFSSHAEFETHFFTHKVLKCRVCQCEFYCKNDLLVHRRKMHTLRKFQCEICHKTFTKLQHLKIHKIKDHTIGEKSYKCVVCGNSYKLPYQLKRHLLNSHIPSEDIECTFCSKICLGPISLKKHIKTYHLYSEKYAPVSCSICGKILRSAFILSKHLETHDIVDTLCKICGQTIKMKSGIRNHMDTYHPKTGTFICEICSEHFGDQKEFRKHKRKHKINLSLEIPAYCEICGKKYKNSHILKKHILVHSNDRPFKCDLCDATFKQKTPLLTHRRVHSDVGKYNCDKCGLTFRWKQTFDKHSSKCEVNKNLEDSEDD